ncbi:MAG: zinc-dependent peptidase [Flavobacteriales bacterium]|nr:zinc-dependent peptidase [Flavobacteriales bacterium]
MKVVVLFLFFLPSMFVGFAYYRYGRRGVLAFVQNKIIYHSPITREQYEELDKYLSNKNEFYKHLSIGGRAKFLQRLMRFNHQMKYEGQEGLEVTQEMKVLVASAAIQLTYGLNYFIFENLKGFKIYPSIFYNRIIKHHLKGGMPPEGKMMLSWEHVQHGFYYPEDRYNLALHEMAHALKLSIKYAYNFDIHFYSYLESWNIRSRRVFMQMKHQNDNFLRAYAATNMEEFFAVSVEHFFEAPDEFKVSLPDLYTQLSIMLNLDPLNKQNDYEIKRRKWLI